VSTIGRQDSEDDVFARLMPLEAAAARAGGLRLDQLTDLGRFIEPIFTDRALPAKIKLFALYLIGIVHGHDAVADHVLLRARRAGLTRAELIDGLMAGVLSRGITVFWKGQRWLDEFPEADDAARGPLAETPRASRESMLEYFAEVWGGIPRWLADLVDAAPDYFDGYFHHRSNVLRDGPLSRKHKELMIVSINAVDRYPFGIEHHMKGAFDGGATRAEVIESMLVAIAAGGMPAFIEAHQVLDRVAPIQDMSWAP
jgi:alkylhydroperoxidase/carboxymuconolactone decarboxylase family protein YurZ